MPTPEPLDYQTPKQPEKPEQHWVETLPKCGLPCILFLLLFGFLLVIGLLLLLLLRLYLWRND